MLDFLADNFRAAAIGGILLVVGLGQLNRLAGSVVGLVFVAMLGLVGTKVYERGARWGSALFRSPKTPSTDFWGCW